MENEKDTIGLGELTTVISRLQSIHESAQNNVGKNRPILNAQEIELVKDHLDLVVKYTKL